MFGTAADEGVAELVTAWASLNRANDAVQTAAFRCIRALCPEEYGQPSGGRAKASTCTTQRTSPRHGPRFTGSRAVLSASCLAYASPASLLRGSVPCSSGQLLCRSRVLEEATLSAAARACQRRQ